MAPYSSSSNLATYPTGFTTSDVDVGPDPNLMLLTVFIIVGVVVLVLIIFAIINSVQRSQASNVNPSSFETTGSGWHPFRVFIKIALLFVLLFVALCNYRLFTFSRGCSGSTMSGDFTESLLESLSVDRIEYYKRTIPSDDSTYKVYIETVSSGYLLDATDADIAAIELLDRSVIIEAEENTIIPFYVEIIVGLLILFIPFGSRHVTVQADPVKEETPENIQPQKKEGTSSPSQDLLKKLNDLPPESKELVEQVKNKLSEQSGDRNTDTK